MSNQLTPPQSHRHTQLQENYRYFAKHALKIKSKAGEMIPFEFNRAQNYIDDRVEDQRRRIGKVRKLILKGRQQGASTYIGGRFYHKTSRNKGRATFILSHEADTTEKLFQMVERFHESCPPPLRPTTDTANRRRLTFSGLGSEYFVGTAGNQNVGRGGTVQYFHGSEVAFWENVDGIVTGVLQSVPDIAGTEIFLESTANGMGNYFYTQCMKAMRGEGEYELIFTPWYWQPEYTKEPPKDFERTAEEKELVATYGLTDAQLYWRRMKIDSFDTRGDGTGIWKFKQEYPMNPIEAFQTSGNSLIKPQQIMAARKRVVDDRNAPRVLGVDPGRDKDRSALVFRQGRKMHWYKVYERSETTGAESQWEMRLAGIIASLINAQRLDKVFIDCTKGWGTHDRLHELGYGDIVVGVQFQESAIEEDVYINKRVEMWCTMADWFSGEVQIPDDDQFHADIACMPEKKETSNGLTKLEGKDKIKEIFGKSPDIGDGAALTFAFPVRRQDLDQPRRTFQKVSAKKGSGLTTMKKFRSTPERGGGHFLARR